MSLTEQEKDRARGQARRAFPDLAGCEHCPATERLERHHPDLNEPLAVTVLCKRCHVAEHKRTNGWAGRINEDCRYQQLAALIRARIKSGEYTHTIPSLERIRQETGLSVMTIRKGIALLADEGVVLLVPGKGTFVRGPQ